MYTIAYTHHRLLVHHLLSFQKKTYRTLPYLAIVSTVSTVFQQMSQRSFFIYSAYRTIVLRTGNVIDQSRVT